MQNTQTPKKFEEPEEIIKNVKLKNIKRVTQKNFNFDEFMDSYTMWMINNNTNLVPSDYVDFRYEKPYPLGQVLKSLTLSPMTGEPEIYLTQKQDLILKDLGFNKNPFFIYNPADFLEHVEKYVKSHKNPVINFGYVEHSGYPLGKKMKLVITGYLIDKGELPASTPHIKAEPTVYQSLERLGQPMTIHRRAGRTVSSTTFNFDQFVQYWKNYTAERIKNNFENPYQLANEYVCPDGYKLGMFGRVLRYSKVRINKGEQPVYKSYDLRPEQWELLKQLNFPVDKLFGNEKRKYDFDTFFDKLLEYKKEHGDLAVPYPYCTTDGYALGKAVQNYRGRKLRPIKHTPLTKEQEEKLNKIGFIWCMDDFYFERFLNHYIQYLTVSNQKRFVPQNYVCEDGYKLGEHAYQIRVGKRNLHNISENGIRLKEEQYKKLNELNFPWSSEHELELASKMDGRTKYAETRRKQKEQQKMAQAQQTEQQKILTPNKKETKK